MRLRYHGQIAKHQVGWTQEFPLHHDLRGIFDPIDKTARLLWSGFWALLLSNTLMKRQNHKYILALREVLFCTLSEEDASDIKKSIKQLGLQLSGDSRHSYIARNFILGLDALLSVFMLVVTRLCRPKLFVDWKFWISYVSWTLFGVIAMKSATAMTFVVFHAGEKSQLYPVHPNRKHPSVYV